MLTTLPTRLSALSLPLALSASLACNAPPGPAAAASAGGAAPALSAGVGAGGQARTVSGVVAETMNSGGYTYARLTQGDKDTWMAATEMTVAVGDTVTATVSMPMENFHSPTLDRDFPLIYFVGEVAKNGQALSGAAGAGAPMGAAGVAMANSHAATSGTSTPTTEAPKVTMPIPAAPGGHTVADLWAKREQLAGTAVIVRGQVMKRNNEIMGKNWFHLQDGSGTADTGTHDLTVTTSELVNVGDVVTVTGTLVTNQDFGAGYAYETMLENAVIKK